jgi:hypothetical protein
MVNYIEWNIPVMNRRRLTLVLPEDVNLRDIEFVEKYLVVLREVLADDAADKAAAEADAAALTGSATAQGDDDAVR